MNENKYSEPHGRLNECYAIPAAMYAAATGLSEADAVNLYHDFMRVVDIDEEVEMDHVDLLRDIFDSEVRDGTSTWYVHQMFDDAFCNRGLLEQRGIAKNSEHYFFNRTLISKHLRLEKWKGSRLDQVLLRFDGAERRQKKLGASVRQCVAVPIGSIQKVLEEQLPDTDFNVFGRV